MKKTKSITKIAVTTGVRAAAIAPGLMIAGIRDLKSVFFGSILGSIGVSIFQIAVQTVMSSFSDDDSED